MATGKKGGRGGGNLIGKDGLSARNFSRTSPPTHNSFPPLFTAHTNWRSTWSEEAGVETLASGPLCELYTRNTDK